MLKKIKTKVLIFQNSFEPLSSPTTINCFIYLLIPIFLILNMFKLTSNFLPQIDMMYIKFFLAFFGATYAYKDLNPYIKNVSNTKTTLIVSMKLIIMYSFFMAVVILIVGNDPQKLQASTLSNTSYYLQVIDLPFTAIGEEVFKALMLLAFIELFKPFKNFKIALAILVSAIIFGLLHINYNYANSLSILFALGFSSIPAFLFFLYYKSIYPVIIVHFIIDFLVISNISENFSFFTTLFQIIWTIVVVVVIFNKGLNPKPRTK